jgi:thymidylate synthase ThyX
MSPVRQVYLLDPQVLSPEIIAVTFAKTSRSPQTFREIAEGLTSEKSAEFHEKWVVGYGHASVAEHAVLHVAVENISRLAMESLESNRLASYTEKSTRYQQWGLQDFFSPPELSGESLYEEYQRICELLFSTYLKIQPALTESIKKECPCIEGEDETSRNRRVHSMVVDVSRFLLPAAAIANVGVTINARALEHTLRKMLSHSLQEVRDIGEEIKSAALESCPTLIKYTNKVPYMVSTASKLRKCSSEQKDPAKAVDWCSLVDYDHDGEERILAAALYRFGDCSFHQYLEHVKSMGSEEKQTLANQLLGDMDEHDAPFRELEYASCSFDLTIDQGAFYELKRHRMMTLTAQELTCDLGYALPKAIVDAGVEKEYCQAMESAGSFYQFLVKQAPTVASYIVPNGYNRRILITANLRSLFHLVSLRCSPNAHFSMRRLAHRMADQVSGIYPILSQYLVLPPDETWQKIESSFYTSTRN